MENKEWKDGLPPVGCECRGFWAGSDQGRVIVKYRGKDCTVLFNIDRNEEQCSESSNYIFEPIKSKQELEREAEIDALFTLLTPVSDQFVERTRLNLGRILDAGYRNDGEEVSLNEMSERLYQHLHTKIKLDDVCSSWVYKNFKIYPRNP